MPVILELDDYETDLVVAALVEGRIKLMDDWKNLYRLPDRGQYEGDLSIKNADIEILDMIRDRLKGGQMIQSFDQPRSAEPQQRPTEAWHHKHGWLHPKKDMETAKAAVEAGDLTREEVADALGFDIAEVDAQIASIRDHLDRLEPGTWTTLPEDAEDWMFDITDGEAPITAGADTQSTADDKVRIDSKHPAKAACQAA